jgi:formate hydrogenlyase transcriptional activator
MEAALMQRSTPTPNQEAAPCVSDDIESQLRRFVETIPTVAWQASAQGQFLFFTQYFAEYTGLTPEQYQGYGWRSTVHPQDLPAFEAAWAAIVAAGQPGDLYCRVRRFDGEYRYVSGHAVPFRNAQGQICGWYGCSIDIEDHKRTDDERRAGIRELRAAVDAIGGLIVVLAPDGTTSYINNGFRQFLGLASTDVDAAQFRQATMHPADIEALDKKRKQGFEQGVSFDSVCRFRRHDGEYRWHQIQYNPLRDESGTVIRWYATGIDVHDRHVAASRLENENIALREEITHSSMYEEIVGSAEPMQRVLADVRKVSQSDLTVLIIGETGTGKELIARAVHKNSDRAGKAFIRVNCAAIPASLMASELFGHEKGAFTGAVQRRIGRFEAADGGTIFLDEIGDLPAEAQVSLLRVLQEREFERVGSNDTIKVDVRVVAATHQDLSHRIASGAFRKDLFYRLNVFPISLPSLRERVSDIPLLVEYFIERYARKARKRITHIEPQTLQLLKSYKWPGNIRELQNVIERAVILADTHVFSVDISWLKNTMEEPASAIASLSTELEARERELIAEALTASAGRIAGPSGAAARLKLPRQTLASRMKALGISKHG